MSALLVLYMVQALLPGGDASSVIGLAALRHALGSPQSNQVFASEVFGLYSGSVYLATIVGGAVADSLLGARRTVVLGALMLSAGHLAMAFDRSFVIALAMLVTGTGLLKGNISAQVGALYPPGEDAARTKGFVLFSTGINVGAVSGPLVCGTLAQVYGWHAGFGGATVLMLVGLATYLAGSRHYALETARKDRDRTPLSAPERKTCRSLLAIAAMTIPLGASYYQISNVGLVWVSQHVSLATPFGAMPATWFSSIDSFASIACVPLLFAFAAWRARRGNAAEPVRQMAWGAMVVGSCWLLVAVPAGLWPDDQVSVLWPLVGFFMTGVGFMLYWPPLLALMAGGAPERLRGRMMALTFASLAISNYGVGWVGSFYEPLGPLRFWLLNASIAGVSFTLFTLFGRKLARTFTA